MSKKNPFVAIVGRTNSGKSTLFNRLSETSKAIISPMENTTRDRNYADIFWQDKKFTLIDTGGMDTAAKDPLSSGIFQQVNKAIEQADLVLFLIDGSTDILPQDRELALLLRKLNKKVILGINKIDNFKKEKLLDQNYHQLNCDHVAIFSALNGSRTGDLLDQIITLLPQQKKTPEKFYPSLKLAIIGRPNVGKSSLINAILGEDKVLVSPLPHTTRDINDVEFIYRDHKFILVDTAGIRRKSRVGDWPNKMIAKIEKEGVHASMETLKRADVVALVLESQMSISSQDQALVELALEERKNIVLVINKWDLVPEKDETTINAYADYFNQKLPFAKWVPMIFVSALNKLRVKKVLDLALEINQQANMQVAEEDLNQILAVVLRKYKPKQRMTITFGQHKSDLKLNFMKQVKTNPPVFFLSTPKPKNISPAIVKIIEKEIRNKYEFLGVPLKIVIGKE